MDVLIKFALQSMSVRTLYETPDGVVTMLDNSVYVVVGFVTTWWIIIALFWKMLRCIRVYLLPKFSRKQIDLVDKFGTWAGNYIYSYSCNRRAACHVGNGYTTYHTSI